MTTCTIEQWSERHWVGIPVTAELSRWDRVNALVPQVFAALAAAGHEPLGGPIYQYHRLRTVADPMDVTVSVPVAAPVQLGTGFDTGTLPAGRYLVARPHGGPDALAQTHRDMGDWAGQQGLELAVDEEADSIRWHVRTEQFLTDPQTEPDRSRWTVEVAYLLR
ncbi:MULTISPECIES: GyrI-like domain-containing protein [unclassified Isoptericola]|uniref:GyrI-like domain-containing protein n=1 Tax=unclassified Isoptericola TaxID=2623355 RepID=UPI002712E30F|nr:MULTISPECIES: GyrI-like domain-containing protein [unclassified Isoptericola]MDO8145308.1 GyrI-like domain-containing protein [Isoptericola sp. 178]MDO8148946.1 GyrI-like domain-containing protein [Isoptericola sp. b515]MDO8151111.1 GyrI-like domain-containing protein [Isoptericola sp. b408]